MTRASLLKKFDTKVQALYDCLYDIKELLDSTEEYDLESLADNFVEEVDELLTEGTYNIELIKGVILDNDE
jgi:hypothetical protein